MARIATTDIDLLRDKADIVEIVSGYTQLKKSGGHTFKGLCPFHSEKTPSFTVDSAKGLVHCFGCGQGGNVYQFIQKVENLPFPDAVEWLARRLNYDLRYEEDGPGAREASSKKRRMLEANRVAMEFFHHALMTSPEAEEARRYLGGRGFGKEVAERWKLGWGPGRNSLCKHLLAKGFTQDEIVAADLGRISERDGALFDSFRQRIIFPTWSVQGDVIAFGARAMGDQQPKYLNTSETLVFSKSRFMYGLDRAKSSLARDNAAIVVEGYTDVIALHEAGITDAVATNGTALGESHFEQLKKFTSRAVLMFDADEAGKGAAEKGWGLNSRVGVEVLVAPLPAGRDPADVAQQDGAEGIRKILDTAQPIRRFMLEQRIAKHRTDTPEARAAAVEDIIPVLVSDPNPIAQHEYVFLAAQRIGVEPEAVQRAIAERASRGPAGTEGGPRPAVAERRLPGHVKVEREALQLLLTKPADAAGWLADVEETDFTSPARRELFRVASEGARAGRGATAAATESLTEDALTLYTELAVGGSEIAASIDDEHVREVFVRLQVFRLEREIKGRRNVLQDINPLEEPQRHDELFTELVKLEARRRDLLRSLAEGAA